MGWVRQTRACAQKNALLRVRTAAVSAVQISFPLFFTVLMVALASSGGPQTTPAELEPPASALPPLASICAGARGCADLITVVPDSPDGRALAARMAAKAAAAAAPHPLVVRELPSAAALLALLHTDGGQWGGVVVSAINITAAEIEYQIHTYLYGIRHSELNSKSPDNSLDARVAGTLASGYASLQRLVLESYAELATGAPFALNITVQPLPVGGSTTPGTSYAVWPYYWVFVFAYVSIFAAVGYIKEKEAGTRCALVQAGLTDSAYWVAGIAVDGVLLLAAAVVFVGSLYAFGLVKHASPPALFFVVLLYGVSQLSIAVLTSAVVSTTRTAGAVLSFGLLASVLVYALAEAFVLSKADASPFFRIVLLFIPSVPFGHFVHILAHMEQDGVAFSFASAALDSAAAASPVSISTAVAFIALDGVLILAAGLYLDQVAPATHSPRKNPLFLFSAAWWRGRRAAVPTVINAPINALSETANLLASATDTPVSIVSLRREFVKAGKPFVAVDDVSLSIRRSEIVCLLGSNGAGKTTVSSILAGSLPPTSGSVHLAGVPLEHALAAGVRIGVCAQHDRLYDVLSAAEHMALFAAMRDPAAADGPAAAVPHVDATTLLADVGLDTLASQGAGTYSGGQKRKLSLALALVGSPAIVLLDEPSSGLDVSARQTMRDVLQRYKAGRAVLLTTHHLEEAEELGDSIAVMLAGKLAVTGTTARLKAHFNVGYRLVVEVADTHAAADHVRAAVAAAVPESAETVRVAGLAEIVFSLPPAAIASFPPLLAELEAMADDPDAPVISFALSLSTLEDVFLKLVSRSEAERATDAS